LYANTSWSSFPDASCNRIQRSIASTACRYCRFLNARPALADADFKRFCANAFVAASSSPGDPITCASNTDGALPASSFCASNNAAAALRSFVSSRNRAIKRFFAAAGTCVGIAIVVATPLRTSARSSPSTASAGFAADPAPGGRSDVDARINVFAGIPSDASGSSFANASASASSRSSTSPLSGARSATITLRSSARGSSRTSASTRTISCARDASSSTGVR
jgi:hypothetical protein